MTRPVGSGVMTGDVLDYVDRSILCWLATVGRDGQPNVSPKEVFAALDSERLVIANIASPRSVRNIGDEPRVCVSFVDVFVQKGYKLIGRATVVSPGDARFGTLSAPLTPMTEGAFTIHGIIEIHVTEVHPLVAPSYRFVPGTTEESQVAGAMAAYGVVPSPPNWSSNMELGAFSVSLAVKDLAESRSFYEKLGFSSFGGDAAHGYLIMKNGDHLIGLFQGMFEKNILTFNPGWDSNAQPLETFTDVRELQRQLRASGVEIQTEADESTTGPASFVVVDPDGNPILVDQHR